MSNEYICMFKEMTNLKFQGWKIRVWNLGFTHLFSYDIILGLGVGNTRRKSSFQNGNLQYIRFTSSCKEFVLKWSDSQLQDSFSLPILKNRLWTLQKIYVSYNFIHKIHPQINTLEFIVIIVLFCRQKWNNNLDNRNPFKIT